MQKYCFKDNTQVYMKYKYYSSIFCDTIFKQK